MLSQLTGSPELLAAGLALAGLRGLAGLLPVAFGGRPRFLGEATVPSSPAAGLGLAGRPRFFTPPEALGDLGAFGDCADFGGRPRFLLQRSSGLPRWRRPNLRRRRRAGRSVAVAVHDARALLLLNTETKQGQRAARFSGLTPRTACPLPSRAVEWPHARERLTRDAHSICAGIKTVGPTTKTSGLAFSHIFSSFSQHFSAAFEKTCFQSRVHRLHVETTPSRQRSSP